MLCDGARPEILRCDSEDMGTIYRRKCGKVMSLYGKKNLKNLVPVTNRTKTEARDISRKGGVKLIPRPLGRGFFNDNSNHNYSLAFARIA
ncbi:MAG: hypothetical protein LBS81_06510 [Endomicrobium sp.]|jgi:hypothetical protein|nr:hypothetical protein [Endomicrobium sp.]